MDEMENSLELLHQKLRNDFSGKIVRKDLTKKIKEGANVPVYVLEYLLGMYCSSQDEDEIDIVNIGLHFFLKNVRPYAASCNES